MSIVTDTFALDVTTSPFIRIDYSAVLDTAGGRISEKASMWIERSSVGGLVAALRACMEWRPTQCVQNGGDSLRVFESGPDGAPYINIENDRARQSEHGGFSWIAMSRGLAERLIEELASLNPG